MNILKIKNVLFSIALIAIAIVGFGFSTEALAQKPKPKLDTPTLSQDLDPTLTTKVSIGVKVTAGKSGAPAGFSIQWMTLEDYNINGWYASDDPRLCKASFSGNAYNSSYNLLAPFQSVTVKIGGYLFDDPGASANECGFKDLNCGLTYVFRVFAHATSTLQRSDFSENYEFKPLACAPPPSPGCTQTRDYWQENVDKWPVKSLKIGNVIYNDTELLAILKYRAPTNGIVSLSRHLIAVKLNIANGADPSTIQATIDAADALIGDLVVPPIGSAFLPTSSTRPITDALELFNEGFTGPGHCK